MYVIICEAKFHSSGKSVTHGVDRQASMELNLADAGATEALGQALARVLPSAVHLAPGMLGAAMPGAAAATGSTPPAAA